MLLIRLINLLQQLRKLQKGILTNIGPPILVLKRTIKSGYPYVIFLRTGSKINQTGERLLIRFLKFQVLIPISLTPYQEFTLFSTLPYYDQSYRSFSQLNTYGPCKFTQYSYYRRGRIRSREKFKITKATLSYKVVRLP